MMSTCTDLEEVTRPTCGFMVLAICLGQYTVYIYTKLPGGSIGCIVYMALIIHYFVLVKVNFSSIKFLIVTCIVTN